MRLRTCWRCFKTQPIEAFPKSKTCTDGIMRRCNACRQIKDRERLRKRYKRYKKSYLDRPEIRKRYAEYQKKYRNMPEHRYKHLARYATKRAIKRGDIIKMPCEVCGNVTVHAHHKKKAKKNKSLA